MFRARVASYCFEGANMPSNALADTEEGNRSCKIVEAVNMKWLYKITLTIFILIIAASGVLTLYYFNGVNAVYENDAAYAFGEEPSLHFSLILNSRDEQYWQDFKEGVTEAKKVYNVAVEVNQIYGPDSNEKIVEYINIANKSQVDGIIVNGENTEEYSKAIKNATESGIDIVVGLVETFDNDRLFYVGTNFSEYGKQAAKLIAQAGGGDKPINLAVILSDKDSSKTSSNNFMNGLKKVIEAGQDIELICTLYKENDLLGAEDITRAIIREHPEVNVIFCTNAKDTVAAARVVVERNLVGVVRIVGTDITDDIVGYIENKVVFGVIDRNGRDAGYQSVEALYNADTFQTSYINIDTQIYTAMNIGQKKKTGNHQ